MKKDIICPNCWRKNTDIIKNWKSRVDLIIPDFVLEIWEVLRMWAEKYKENSWQWVPVNDHYAAAMRHLLAWKKWEKLDQESWKNHLVHAATNLMFIFFNDK